MKRRLVLVDDHDLFLAGVRAELGDGVDVVGEAGTVADAVPLIKRLDPDVVLLDVHLPDGSGDAIINAVALERPGVKFLALSVSDAAEDVIAVLPEVTKPVRFTLRGIPVPEYVSRLSHLAESAGVKNQVDFLPIASPNRSRVHSTAVRPKSRAPFACQSSGRIP